MEASQACLMRHAPVNIKELRLTKCITVRLQSKRFQYPSSYHFACCAAEALLAIVGCRLLIDVIEDVHIK